MTEIIEWIKAGIGIEIGMAMVGLFIVVPIMIILCPIFIAIQMYKDKKDGMW